MEELLGKLLPVVLGLLSLFVMVSQNKQAEKAVEIKKSSVALDSDVLDTKSRTLLNRFIEDSQNELQDLRQKYDQTIEALGHKDREIEGMRVRMQEQQEAIDNVPVMERQLNDLRDRVDLLSKQVLAMDEERKRITVERDEALAREQAALKRAEAAEQEVAKLRMTNEVLHSIIDRIQSGNGSHIEDVQKEA